MSQVFVYIQCKSLHEVTHDTTYEPLYDTTNTVPGGAIYHDYPLAFNINLRNTTTTECTLKYKVVNMNIKKNLFTNNYLSRFITRQANIGDDRGRILTLILQILFVVEMDDRLHYVSIFGQ